MADSESNWVRTLAHWAKETPDAIALVKGQEHISYGRLWHKTEQFAAQLARYNLPKGARVAFYLPKSIEAVIALIGTARVGFVSVPVNPVLKVDQFSHILQDAAADILITVKARMNLLSSLDLGLADILCVDELSFDGLTPGDAGSDISPEDLAVLFYTSGSTGRPKGVMITHDNLSMGAEIVAAYLGLRPDDKILSLLPWSFDYGFNQLSGGFHVGATVVLMDFLLPQDVPRQVERHGITVLGCVPPLWHQLMDVKWTEEAAQALRVVTNTGGRVSPGLSAQLKAHFPNARLFLMYGLTEAFRSTYLEPNQLVQRPDSIGKAIPGEEVLIVDEAGEKCAPGVAGELVHSGRLVSKGYWRDEAKTEKRFKAPPKASRFHGTTQKSVYSGDKARYDEEGFIYFIGRDDEMIKTSGYRVSPAEIEEIAMTCEGVMQAFACGMEDERLGQSIALVLQPGQGSLKDEGSFLKEFKGRAPAYMVPQRLIWLDKLPMGPHGKLDRQALAEIAMKGA